MGSKTDKFTHAFEAILRAVSVYEALSIFQTIYCVDFVTYHLAATIVSDIDMPFVRTTYPPEWVSSYFLNNYVQVDPVAREGFLRQAPFDWEEVEVTTEALAFFEDARRHGVGRHGYTIPIFDRAGRRAIFSINVDQPILPWNLFVEQNRSDWLELAYQFHLKSIREIHGADDPVPVLSGRERECLYWAARGYGYKRIALQLGISAHTARGYIKSARTKLGCPTISSAVILAMKYRLISI
ncbi:LuxR family transcriptional regulator [Rhizobium pusense]|uniref:helix-turn-helix transcriptional regulator n=1 Tax=Agrobacterium pusense TaxID=648995 RepID=UPI002446C4FF|nr:LuxR family transcriptional regulator [Agrobacterium pusense]MDH1270585.1 LuxR family transcriptional regulator [Agrobacterium pusense]